MPGIRDAGAAGCGEAAGRPGGGEGTGSLVSWRRRPCRTSALFAAANAVWWFVASGSLRIYSLLSILMALLVVTATAREIIRSRSAGLNLWRSMTTSWEIIDSGQSGRSGPGLQLSDSLRVFLQETSAFKQQNPGKFCLLVCSLCTFFAVLGRYIPGIVISYVLVLSVFLWPLVSSHEVGLWLKPVLQKLDFGIGGFLQKVRENHERRIIQSQMEKEGIESDLSSMFPKLDSAACKEMSVSDTEVSDVTWTDNGTFNLSEGHTPQTENSDDLDREEVFAGGLPEFPSLDNGATTNGDDDDDDLSLGLPPPPPQPQKPAAHRAPPADRALELVNQMAGDVITAAVTAAIQERIEAAVGLAAPSGVPGAAGLLELAEESDSEAEDFELLDQSELEQLEGELGLGGDTGKGKDAQSDKPGSSGFFSKLLRRH
ncbi:reticulophagy regulator 1 isoform X2 [Salarias fasciatus]|uniref:reticulophagy regulator 1 isoform X2 n=1 Tax=Salarias fasciatus TaxID=181472 RepID=UPI001176740A|nr:reticulophagy regulator 1 isoform X2 [Salarias fasciatus]